MFIIIELIFGVFEEIYACAFYDDVAQLISSNNINEYSLYQFINGKLILLRSVNENGYVISVKDV